MKLEQVRFVIVLIIITSAAMIGCNEKSKAIDCSNLKGQELLIGFKTTQMDLRKKRFNKYLVNEELYYNKELELETIQINDTLLVNFLTIGGLSSLNCVAIQSENKTLNITNYESDYIKEISIRRIEYKILNKEGFSVGNIDYKKYRDI